MKFYFSFNLHSHSFNKMVLQYVTVVIFISNIYVFPGHLILTYNIWINTHKNLFFIPIASFFYRNIAYYIYIFVLHNYINIHIMHLSWNDIIYIVSCANEDALSVLLNERPNNTIVAIAINLIHTSPKYVSGFIVLTYPA